MASRFFFVYLSFFQIHLFIRVICMNATHQLSECRQKYYCVVVQGMKWLLLLCIPSSGKILDFPI